VNYFVLERQQDAVAELRQLAAKVPKSRSLVDELLAERRLAHQTNDVLDASANLLAASGVAIEPVLDLDLPIRVHLIR
jgi:hypothetical protein